MLSVFAISGLTSGFAAVLTLSRVMSASMKTLVSLELDSIAAVTIGGISLLGGRGSVIGAVIGVLIIGVINNGMSVLGTGPGQQGVIKGAIIIAAVAVDYLRRQRQTLG
jgi:ribose/xylose/arabinose/galactoside ABC-type transport system permease subunit